ncbi:MAG: hypothetical protein AAGP08_17265 [Pseudomonadota bacterium]
MVHGFRFYFVVAFLWASLSAHAAEMELADYDELAAILSYTEDFEHLEFPRRFTNLPNVTRFHAAEYGSHFVGQVVVDWHIASGTFDQLRGNPDATMSVASGGPLENVLAGIL